MSRLAVPVRAIERDPETLSEVDGELLPVRQAITAKIREATSGAEGPHEHRAAIASIAAEIGRLRDQEREIRARHETGVVREAPAPELLIDTEEGRSLLALQERLVALREATEADAVTLVERRAAFAAASDEFAALREQERALREVVNSQLKARHATDEHDQE